MSWPVIKFSEAISRSGLFSDGDWVESKDQNPEGDVRLIQLADIGVGEFIDKSNRFMTSKRADELRCSYLKAGDILVARMPDPIGRACIFPEDMGRCVTVVDICIVRPDSERIDNRWLMHLINSERFRNQIDRHVTGTTRQRISRGNLAGLEIPLPPLPEQKRIAAILDKADAIRRKRQQAIQLADDFLRAVFLDMFGDPVTNPKGWPVDKFGNVFDVRDGTHDSPSYVSSGFPLITSKNIKNGEIDMLDVNYISKEDYELINRRSKVDVGDILMPMIGTIGNPAIVRDEPLFAIKNVALIKLGRSSLPAEFVLALLNGPLLEAAVQQKSRGGTQKFLGLGDIRDLNCYLPDERLVSKYIGIANKVRQFASAYRKADEAGLEGSLSQKAFSGHL